uniref:Putative secreted protein n=1 Tax=Ixodes ricinus TaxID=34613 RepID=A0A6B0UA08_IXORI
MKPVRKKEIQFFLSFVLFLKSAGTPIGRGNKPVCLGLRRLDVPAVAKKEEKKIKPPAMSPAPTLPFPEKGGRGFVGVKSPFFERPFI